YGFTSAILRRIGEGQAVAGAFSWLKAEQSVGASTESAAAEISWAYRPSRSDWSLLNKLELRHDAVRGAISGQPGPIGGLGLTIDGDATSRRIINSLSVNYTPKGRDGDILGSEDGNYFERGEYSLFWGTRYASEKIGADDVTGWSNVIGGDFRFDISSVADIGGQATIRIGSNGKNIAYSGGPAITSLRLKMAILPWAIILSVLRTVILKKAAIPEADRL
ncbi:MAG: hypothetical protein HC843_11575, partial [Sphingomonadales bacterium]|nr:hypothetical protein [Sphingomonadales bacterium]